jgi:AraC-like DNA-binding protein
MAPHGVSVALLRPIAELLGRLEIDPKPFLATLGIDDGTSPDTFVSGDEVDRLLAEIAERRGDPAFSLTLIHAALARPLGLFGHLVWLSGTVREAIARAIRFYAMVSRRTMVTLEEAIVETEGGARESIATLRQHRVASLARGAILTEFVFASFALRARAATGEQFRLRAVRFAHPNDGVARARYEQTFGAPVTFGCAIDELEFDAAQLDLRLATADPITSAALEAKVAALADATTGRNPFIDRVRRAAASSLAEHASPAKIAHQLGISARTLRRHLEQEGTSLRALVDDVRRERADELLEAGTPVKEIAFVLGFSETSAFSRAYKRWTGRPPRLA